MRLKRNSNTDSDLTSIGASPPRRPTYFVESPSPLEVEKISLQSSPIDSSPPLNNHLPAYSYRLSPINHSRQSSNSRFSTETANGLGAGKNDAGWGPMTSVGGGGVVKEEDVDGYAYYYERDANRKVRIVFLLVFGFVIMFSIFSLSLWGASKAHRPRVTVQNAVFDSFDVQAGVDDTGVATEMLSLNSTVAITYTNRGMFFGIHVLSTPWELYCYQLKVASGQMEKFYVERKSKRMAVTMVQGRQVPVYGAVTGIKNINDRKKFVLPMNLTLTVRSKAYILGKLVQSKFYNQIRCPVTLRGNQLGKKLNIANCVYQ